MVIRFPITQASVDRFVELTGDRNSMHVSEEFARRFRFRRRVVHGMLPFAHLMFVHRLFPGKRVELVQCQTKFHKPVFVDDVVRLEIEISPANGNEIPYEARWVNDRNEDLLIKSRGMLRVLESATNPEAVAAEQCFITEPLSENDLSIEELAGRSETLSFRLTEASIHRFCESVLEGEPIGRTMGRSNFLATVLLSTLVGMKLPGRYATFSGFQLAFEKSVPTDETCQWKATTGKVTVATESAELAVVLTGGENNQPLAVGSIQSMVNPRARVGITCREIQEGRLDLGLRGKVVIVTGSSRGIGAATAKLMAMLGAKVVVNYAQGRADAESVVEDIQSAGGAAIAVQCDVRDAQQVKLLVARAVAEWGAVHILVNNAVKDTQAREAMELGWDDFLGELEVTLKGMHHCCREVVPLFKLQGGGKIVNLSTIFVDNPVKGQCKYITAKSAVVGYSRSLAKELAGDNIQVNVLAPNMTSTDLLAGLPTEIVRRMGQQRPGKRNMDPVEVAQAIVFLASQWSNSMNGQKLVLNLGEPPFA